MVNWTVESVAIDAIKRRKQPPNYGFIEQATVGGTAYTIQGEGGAGYFIVASANSLAPGFIVELALPELAVQERYEALLAEMRKRSLGMMWFDSSDRDACDFAWRLNLPIRSGSPLFQADIQVPEISNAAGFEVVTAGKADEDAIVELLTAAPPDAGGQTKEAVLQNLYGGCIAALKRNQEILGAAVLTPLPGCYVALSSVVMRTYADLANEAHQQAHRELELIFMAVLSSRVARRKLGLVYSMARQTPTGYLEAIQLNMKVVKQGFIASLREMELTQESSVAPVVEGGHVPAACP
jgi:hypothetical protein